MDDNTKNNDKYFRMKSRKFSGNRRFSKFFSFKWKKAMQVTLKDLILIAIVAIVLIFFTRSLTTGLTGLSNKEVCRLSVLAKSEGKIVGFEGTSSLDCYTNYIDVKDNGIYLSNNKIKDSRLEVNFKGMSQEQKDEQIKAYLANQLYDCWYQFGQGNIDFLSNYDWGSSDMRCFPCASVSFYDSFLDSFTYEDWEVYLSEKKTPSGTSYKQYLSGGNNMYSDNYKSTIMSAKKGNNLAIYFIGAKTSTLKMGAASRTILFFVSPLIFGISETAGAVSKTFLSWVYVVDSDSIVDKCDYMY